MLKPRLLGVLVLLYALLYKAWEFAGLGFSTLGGGLGGAATIPAAMVIVGHAVLAVSAFVLISYLIGGVGLILRRRGFATLVFYAAIIEATLIVLAGGAFVYATIAGAAAAQGDLKPWHALAVLPLLAFPVGFAYAARILRQHPEVWQPSRPIVAARPESSHDIATRQSQPALLQKTFWAAIGTGPVLTIVLALYAVVEQSIRGNPFVLNGDAVFVFSLGIVLFTLPYIVFAYIMRSMLRKPLQEGGDKLARKSFLLGGVFLGMTGFAAANLYSYFSAGEGVEVLFFAPFAPFFAVLPGVVLGWLIGLIAYYLSTFWHHHTGGPQHN